MNICSRLWDSLQPRSAELRLRVIFYLLVLPLSALLIIFPARPSQALAQPCTADANKVRATYLYNLIWFVHWDHQDLGPARAPFNILVMGNAAMASDIKNLTRGESFQGHSLVVTDTPVLSLADYRIIHIPCDLDSRTGDILAQTRDSHTLIIGDDMKFLHQGGMVAFIRTESTIKIYVNLQALERAHIKLSAKLLKIATHIAPLPEERQ